MSERLTLAQKLALIAKMTDAVQKNKKGYNYTYADITEILAKVKAGMFKYGVILVPQVVPETMKVEPYTISKTKFSKSGDMYEDKKTEMLVNADMVFEWINVDDPTDTMVVPWAITGSQEDPSQSFGSSITYCTRYFLTSFFQIAQTDNDVDSYRSKQKEAEEEEGKIIASEIISSFDSELRLFLSSNEDKKDEVKKFVSKYSKSGNYNSIKDPALASKLLEDFRANFINK